MEHRGPVAPKNLATGQNAYTEDAYRDWSEVFAHSFNTWGRTIEFEVVTPTSPDEAGQRADTLTVAEKKPFAVIVQATGTGQVFANDLVAKKILVFYAGPTNARGGRAGAVPVALRHRLERGRGERRAVRGTPTEGRDREVVG